MPKLLLKAQDVMWCDNVWRLLRHFLAKIDRISWWMLPADSAEPLTPLSAFPKVGFCKRGFPCCYFMKVCVEGVRVRHNQGQGVSFWFVFSKYGMRKIAAWWICPVVIYVVLLRALRKSILPESQIRNSVGPCSRHCKLQEITSVQGQISRILNVIILRSTSPTKFLVPLHTKRQPN